MVTGLSKGSPVRPSRSSTLPVLEMGTPVFVSEFGTCDASGSGGMSQEESDAWISRLDKEGVSYIAWNLSNKDETSAIFKPDCEKPSGFTTDDLTENGLWIYNMLKSK